jgi:hypothetical protein
MQQTYTVTKRDAKGAPRQIQCAAHEGCDWTLASTGARRDDDPIFRSQFEEHLRIREVPDAAAFGHLRRRR